MAKNIVHVIGTGTIGEPLIGLLTDHRDDLGIDEVTFYKNMPYSHDRPKMNQMIAKGAKLAVKDDRVEAFEKLGHKATYDRVDAIERASVVIDCTPSGIGVSNKNEFYERFRNKVKGFIAQGSEFGFGKMYAGGINDSTLVPGEDQYVHVVSCNTHNLAVLLKSLGDDGKGGVAIDEGRFLCLRRSNDISQESAFVPSPQVGDHGDARFGTHHARDAYHLFSTMGLDLKLFSSAVKLNTQYMHAVHFSIRVPHKITVAQAVERFRENPRVALTEKKSANTIFSFGREHGHYGRILSQTVIVQSTIAVRDEHEVVGFCFTPQDGNSLLSSVAATMWFLDRESMDERLACLSPYLFQEV